MSFRVSGETVTSTLTIAFTDDTVTTKVNADSTPVLNVYLASTLVFTIQGGDITNSVTGVYTALWVPASAGTYTAIWSFAVSEVSYTQDEDVFVLAAAVTSVTPTGEPDLGTDSTCLVTGTFITSEGNYKKGILVRFGPLTAQDEHTTYGYISGDVTAESTSDGALSMYLLRGVTGLLTISQVGLVRRVTVPDKATVDIFDLAATGDDLLEVQTPQFYTLPRRS